MSAALASHALTAADRCDRCGARAYLRVTLPGGGELFFCAHHGRTHEDALVGVGAAIEDETNRLTGVPASASDDEK